MRSRRKAVVFAPGIATVLPARSERAVTSSAARATTSGPQLRPSAAPVEMTA